MLKWFRKDHEFDRDQRGNLKQEVSDTDPSRESKQKYNTSDLSVDMVMVEDGRGSVVVEGEADRAGRAYAVVYLDEICTIPLARSPVQP